eukprot:jgi/Chlat1/5836/Chrsp4S06359
MKLKQLEALLGDVEPFAAPRIELEQYPTGAHIAARMLYTMDASYGDIEGKLVVDLGCGGGVLGIGALALGAGHVVGVDVDESALELTRANCESFEFEDGDDMDLVLADVSRLTSGLRAETVVMNPPFGTRQKGADMIFLGTALQIASEAVYSLHKSSTREHVHKASKSLGARSAEVLAELRYNLPATYSFHKRREVDIAVDLWRFEPDKKDRNKTR